MCKTIKQKVKFKATPRQVYDLLADSKNHSAFSGKKASIPQKIGGKFSAYAGKMTGIVVDLKPGVRIVEAWRNEAFPDGIYSMAAFNLTRTRDGGAELVLTHRGVPKELIPSVEKAWRELYWDKMKRFLKR